MFTKDGAEYTGPRVELSALFVTLFRVHIKRVVVEKTGLSRLFSPSFWKEKEHSYRETDRTDDYIIPTPEVIRIERWDVPNNKEEGG